MIPISPLVIPQGTRALRRLLRKGRTDPAGEAAGAIHGTDGICAAGTWLIASCGLGALQGTDGADAGEEQSQPQHRGNAISITWQNPAGVLFLAGTSISKERS